MRRNTSEWWLMWFIACMGGLWGFIEIAADQPFDGAVTFFLSLIILEKLVIGAKDD